MNKLYVFTSTGNSLKLANTLAEQLGETEVLSIPVMMRQKEWHISGDKVGFIIPTYYGTVPQLVVRFIKEAASISGDYFFALVSAGANTGLSLCHLRALLKRRNVELHYGKSLLLASNYMNGWYYSMLMPSAEKIKKLVVQADEKCITMAAEIRNMRTHVERSSYAGYLMPHIISPSRYWKDTRPWDREFSVNSSCKGCGTCVKACPVQNISMEEGKPVFKHNCQRCMGCIQFCPRQAFCIEGKPMDKAHYSHPQIKKQELFQFHR